MPYAFEEDDARTTVFAAILDAAKKHGRDKAILEDAERAPQTYRDVILRSFIVGAKLSRGTRPGDTVAILLPNVAAMPLAILGLNAFNRVAALLNFTAGSKNTAAAIRTAVAKRVVTSRRFVETAKLEPVVEALAAIEVEPGKRIDIVYLEDVRASVGPLDKIVGLSRATFARLVHAAMGARPEDTAVILFTSGTEGAPKGVALTNLNIVANALQVIDHGAEILDNTEVLLNPLPIFHSFGLTAGTLMPLIRGIKTVLYPSPLHYRQVAALARATGAHLLLATDTFLQGYARAAEPDDFKELRFVVLGAERVKERTRELWSSRFKAHLLEGYGVTETAPVLACNLPSDNRLGTVGRLVRGVDAKLEPVEGVTEGGRLFVRGSNVMAGYIAHDRPGVVVPPHGGWHDTGDIVAINDDGFVAIKGRAKRFAKIGGEMVSLAAVEALAADLWPDAQSVVVTIPDDRKGEQLVLVTDKPEAGKEALLNHARRAGFPELWAPKVVVVVDSIPVLGAGKADLAATREIARQSRALL